MGNGVAFRKGIAASNSEEGAPPGISYLAVSFLPIFLLSTLAGRLRRAALGSPARSAGREPWGHRIIASTRASAQVRSEQSIRTAPIRHKQLEKQTNILLASAIYSVSVSRAVR